MVVCGAFSDASNVEGHVRVNEADAAGKSNLDKALAGFGLKYSLILLFNLICYAHIYVLLVLLVLRFVYYS
jgi:hypothetical protein